MGELSIIGYSWLGAIFSIKNKMNDMIYVGKSATSFDRRWNIHKSDLKIGKHSNKNLQNDWNIYGEDAFIFSIVEEKKMILILMTWKKSGYINIHQKDFIISLILFF